MGLLASYPAAAVDLGSGFTLSGVAAAAGQCQQLSGDTPGDDRCRGALVLQPELSFQPAKGHELHVKLGFAAGNGLDDVSPFSLPTWAADLEDGVRDVNGGGWDHLLTGWYRYTRTRSAGDTVDVTVGIIDGADFLDTNAYSNDEYTQFMHTVLVNGPNVFVPSYAPGLAVRWDGDRLTLTGVYMRVGQAETESFDFYAVEAGYQVETRLGSGNYRLLVDSTSESFPDPEDRKLERRTAVLLSFDQQVGAGVGAFVRLGLQTDGSAVAYGTLYSGGIELGGDRWGRNGDTIGVGYARLDDGNMELRATRVFETYYRILIDGGLAVTADVQHVHDDVHDGDDASGWVLGLRATYGF